MHESLRSAAAYGTALICFLLPWMNFSCEGQHAASLTGLELVTGTTLVGERPKESTTKVDSEHLQDRKARHLWRPSWTSLSTDVDPEPLAIAILLAAIVGIALSFLQNKKASFIRSVLGLLALVLLLLLKSKLEAAVITGAKGMVQVEYAFGGWLAFIMFAAAFILNGYLYFNSAKGVQLHLPQP